MLRPGSRHNRGVSSAQAGGTPFMRGAWRDMVFEPKYDFPPIAIGKPRKDIFTIHPLTCALEGMRDMQEYVSIFCGDTTSESAWGKANSWAHVIDNCLRDIEHSYHNWQIQRLVADKKVSLLTPKTAETHPKLRKHHQYWGQPGLYVTDPTGVRLPALRGGSPEVILLDKEHSTDDYMKLIHPRSHNHLYGWNDKGKPVKRDASDSMRYWTDMDEDNARADAIYWFTETLKEANTGTVSGVFDKRNADAVPYIHEDYRAHRLSRSMGSYEFLNVGELRLNSIHRVDISTTRNNFEALFLTPSLAIITNTSSGIPTTTVPFFHLKEPLGGSPAGHIVGIESIEVAEDGAAKVTFNTPATYTS